MVFIGISIILSGWLYALLDGLVPEVPHCIIPSFASLSFLHHCIS